MPALAPPIADAPLAKLIAIGKHIRAHRKGLRVSATDAAEASGISRVTLHRIERGEPSVAMAAYMNAVAALGLELEVVNPQGPLGGRPNDSEMPLLRPTLLPPTIRLADYPQLKSLAWQLSGVAELTPEEALGLYERNWRHVDMSVMDLRERTLVNALAKALAGGRLLV
jgi:transcriptional regulator with XRE-family HTH domain